MHEVSGGRHHETPARSRTQFFASRPPKRPKLPDHAPPALGQSVTLDLISWQLLAGLRRSDPSLPQSSMVPSGAGSHLAIVHLM